MNVSLVGLMINSYLLNVRSGFLVLAFSVNLKILLQFSTRIKVKSLEKWEILIFITKIRLWRTSCNRIVVSTSRCGRDNPGSNPGYSILFSLLAF